MNIHVYKTISPQGKVNYTSKSKDERGSIGVGSIGETASVVRGNLYKFLKEGIEQVSIDFSQFHDVEWTSGSEPVRCLALSREEQEVFWLHFLRS